MVTRGIHRGECGLVKGPLDAATVGGALAKGIQLFFIHWLVIDIYPCVVKGAWGEVSQLLLCCGWRMILTGFVVLELGALRMLLL